MSSFRPPGVSAPPSPLRRALRGAAAWRCGLQAWGRALAGGLAVAALVPASAATAAPSAAAAVGRAPAVLAPERWQAWSADGFQHIGGNDGLPNDITIGVVEDSQGYIWIGTLGGMARWDGYQFRVHKFEPGKPGTLPDNLVQLLHRDQQGRPWVGTSAGGLSRYDPVGERFVTIGAGAGGLSHVSVRALADDGDGGLWVGTDGGLDHVDGSGRVTRVPLGEQAANGLRGDRVLALLRDRRGRLWAGTSAGLFRRDAGGAQFAAVLLPLPPGAAADARQPQPESLLEDSAGRFWIGTTASGAFVLERDDAPARPVLETSGVAAGAKSLSTRRVMTLLEARPGEVWIGTLGQGIVAVDTASGRTRRLSHRPLAPATLPDNSVRGLFRDPAGLVWVATHGGVSRLDPRTAAVLTISGTRPGGPDGRSLNDYSALLAHSDGRVWMGSHTEGVEIVDPARGHLQTLRPDPTRPAAALPANVVISLVEGDDGSVHIGTYGGLYRASADGRRVARIGWPGRRADTGIGPLLRDGSRLWVGGLIDGLWSLDLATGRALAVLPEPARQLSDRRITALARAPKGALWIGTRNGLNHFDPGTGQVQQILAGAPSEGRLAAGFVTSLLVDRQGRLWVATYGGGVQLLEPGAAGAAPRFRRVSSAEGLPDDNANTVIEDEAGRIWCSTDSGLAVIDPATLRARPLRRPEGVVFQSYWTGSAARTAQGELLFGASGGLTVVRPMQLQTWDHRPPVVVTDLRIGGQAVPAANTSSTTGPGAAALRVPANANSLAVEFAALDYSAPERNRYAHRLVGYDADWVPTDAKRRLATYANLPPGDYRLELRGSNRDGVFNERVLTLPVQVQAAWHQTPWFRTAATLAVLLALYAVVHVRTRVLQSRRRELQRLVDERTAELQAVSMALTEKTRALEEKSRVLEQASISDPLTGLHNRRFLTDHIEGVLAASLRRAQTGGHPAGAPVDTDTLFFLIDVDHFKRVNDAIGHAAGDAVLVQLAQRLKAAMRESDDVVRWGGEEFLAVAHDTDRARADELAERIRAGVADHPFRLDDGRLIRVTCSVGHACWPLLPAHPQALDWLGVVNLADIGLLTAKRLGRNAWVGLHGGPQARPEGLQARVLAAPQQALQAGEIGISSSQALSTVADALAVIGEGTCD